MDFNRLIDLIVLFQVISPALGEYLREVYSDTLIVALATAIAVLDVFFILVAVPESLPEKVRPSSWGAPISWEQADPFAVRSTNCLEFFLEIISNLIVYHVFL